MTEGIRQAIERHPDIDGHEVDFDDLMSRLARYRETERPAAARFEELLERARPFL